MVHAICQKLNPVGPGDETVIASRPTAVSMCRVALPAETDAEETDRLVIGGREYEVVSVPVGPYEVPRVAICEKVG